MDPSVSPPTWQVRTWSLDSEEVGRRSSSLGLPEAGAGAHLAFLAVSGCRAAEPEEGAASLACRTVHSTVLEFLKAQPDPDDLLAIKSQAETELPKLLAADAGDSTAPATHPYAAVDLVSIMITDVFALYLRIGSGELMVVAEDGSVSHPLAGVGAVGDGVSCRVRFEPFRDPPPTLILASTTEFSAPLPASEAKGLIRRAREEETDALEPRVRELLSERRDVAVGTITRLVATRPGDAPGDPAPAPPPSPTARPSVAPSGEAPTAATPQEPPTPPPTPPPAPPAGPSRAAQSAVAKTKPDATAPPLRVEAPKRLPGRPGLRRVGLWAVLAVAAGLLLYSLTALFQGSPHPTYERALNALEMGWIATPPSQSAIAYFYELSDVDPNSDEVKDLGARIAAQALPLGEDAFHRFYTDSDQDIDWFEIQAFYDFLAEVEPDNRDYLGKAAYCRAHLALGREDFRIALAAYREALKHKPGWALACNGLAKVYVRKNSPYYDLKIARRYYEEAFEKDQTFVFPLINLAATDMEQAVEQRDRRLWASAEVYLKTALQVDPHRASIYRRMAVVQERLGRPDQAIRYYQDSIEHEDDAQINTRTRGEIRRLQRRR